MNTLDWNWISSEGSNVLLSLRVIPNAKKPMWTSEVIDGACKVRIATPAVEGAANKALIRFLAKYFSVKQNQITIVSGEKSRLKRIRVIGLDKQTAVSQLSKTL